MQWEIVLIWFVVIAAAPPSTESPIEAVRGTVNQVLSILKDPALKDTSMSYEANLEILLVIQS
jgi:hypothetical protein